MHECVNIRPSGSASVTNMCSWCDMILLLPAVVPASAAFSQQADRSVNKKREERREAKALTGKGKKSERAREKRNTQEQLPTCAAFSASVDSRRTFHCCGCC